MTSPSELTTMRSPSNNTALSTYPTTGNCLVLQSDATTHDQTAHPTKPTCTSLSAAAPRTSHLSPHEPASMMEAAMTPITLDDAKLLTYTADIKQFADTTDCIMQPLTTQSSQLDSTLLGKLSRELRDQIYREAVVEDNDIPIHVSRHETEDGERRRRLEIGHSLLRVCKQTREEVAEIYYLENTFRITDSLFEKRAIRELNRLLTPWAGRMAKLNVSHTFDQTSLSRAKINFSISTTSGRIVVEPESSNIRFEGYGIDSGQGWTICRTEMSERICFCKIFKLAMEHNGHDVLGWMQKYVDLVHKSQDEPNNLIHCWTCAGHVIL